MAEDHDRWGFWMRVQVDLLHLVAISVFVYFPCDGLKIKVSEVHA